MIYLIYVKWLNINQKLKWADNWTPSCVKKYNIILPIFYYVIRQPVQTLALMYHIARDPYWSHASITPIHIFVTRPVIARPNVTNSISIDYWLHGLLGPIKHMCFKIHLIKTPYFAVLYHHLGLKNHDYISRYASKSEVEIHKETDGDHIGRKVWFHAGETKYFFSMRQIFTIFLPNHGQHEYAYS